MATYSRREVTVTTVEYAIPATPPWGAHCDEIAKAMTAARAEIGDQAAIWVHPRDDEIVIRFEKSKETT